MYKLVKFINLILNNENKKENVLIQKCLNTDILHIARNYPHRFII